MDQGGPADAFASARSAVAELRRSERDALFLTTVWKLSYADAAKTMGLSTEEFTDALLKARSKLLKASATGRGATTAGRYGPRPLAKALRRRAELDEASASPYF
jgi:predicted DNA-binding protein (UPF0251 family)